MGIGHLLSAGLVVAVAALAGRALRHRFRRERVVGETSGTHGQVAPVEVAERRWPP
jgi:hypothetical protein